MKQWVLPVVLLFIAPLQGGFNEDVDRGTYLLIENIAEFQTEEYLLSYKQCVDIRSALLQETSVCKTIRLSKEEAKFIVDHERFEGILKKRSKDNCKEFYVWELSYLLGIGEFIVPSLAVEIEDKKVIVQPRKIFIVEEKASRLPPRMLIDRVSVLDYWKVHIGAYLLGLYDLIGGNIGITPGGKLCLFDMEASFKYNNAIKRRPGKIEVGFLSQGFDWPQYRQRLSSSEVKELKEFIGGLALLPTKWLLYQKIRPYFSCDWEGVCFRLEKVLSFPLQEERSFCDFYTSIEPIVAPALQELSPLATQVMGRPVGDGSLLMFISRGRKKYEVSLKQEKIIQQWIEEYVEE